MKGDFENAKTHNDIYYSRYIASWRNAGGEITPCGLFDRWLREVEKLTDEEIRDIYILATNGKFELQESARAFMRSEKNK